MLDLTGLIAESVSGFGLYNSTSVLTLDDPTGRAKLFLVVLELRFALGSHEDQIPVLHDRRLPRFICVPLPDPLPGFLGRFLLWNSANAPFDRDNHLLVPFATLHGHIAYGFDAYCPAAVEQQLGIGKLDPATGPETPIERLARGVEGIRAIGQELRQGDLRREVDQVVPGGQARRTFD